MIKVSVLYPYSDGVRFDHAYYVERHMPMVATLMGAACKGWHADKGLGGGAPGVAAPYVAMCHILADSLESFNAGFGPHVKQIMADVPNYTDAKPVMQVSEVLA